MTSKATTETMKALRLQGYRWSIETKVEHNTELHLETERLDGSHHIQFIAELDGYGNVVEWGLYDESRTIHEGRAPINADGETVQ